MTGDESFHDRAIVVTASSTRAKCGRGDKKKSETFREKVVPSMTTSTRVRPLKVPCHSTIKLTCTFVGLLTQQPNTAFGANTMEVADTKVGRYTNRTSRKRARKRGGVAVAIARTNQPEDQNQRCAEAVDENEEIQGKAIGPGVVGAKV